MKNNLFKNLIGILSVFTLLFVASCSDDDNNAQVEVKVESGNHVVYASKGELQVAVNISGLSKDPQASDFTATVSSLQWEEGLDDVAAPASMPTVEVKSVEKGTEAGAYTLTLEYDVTGYAECSYQLQVVFDKNKVAEGTVSVNCYPYSANTIELPLQEITVTDNDITIKVNILDAWSQLGIQAPLHGNENSSVYGGLNGEVPSRNSFKVDNNKNILLAKSFDTFSSELNEITVKDARNLTKGKVYGVLVVVPAEDGKSVGVYRSFLVK